MSLDPTTVLAFLAGLLPILGFILFYSSTFRAAFLGMLELGIRRVRAAFHPRPALLWIAWARQARYGFLARAFVAQAVKTGDPEGLLEQGLLYLEGGLGAAGREGAVAWFRRAAEAGQPDAMYWLAQAMLWGDAGLPDRPGALAWMRRGAEAGSGACMARLAEELRGSGTAEGAEEAQRWDSRRNAAGLDREPRHSAARAGAGSTRPARGRGGRDTLDERFLDRMVELSKRPWFQRGFWALAALALLLSALTFIVIPAWIIYTFATSLAAPGLARSAPLWLSTGLLLGLAGLALWLWREVRNPKQDAGTRRLLTQAGEGDPRAAFDLAQAYRRGSLGLPKDALEARVWLARAAEAGHLPAMLDLSAMLESGEGGLPDRAQARIWLQRAAEAGSAEAGRRLDGGIAPKK